MLDHALMIGADVERGTALVLGTRLTLAQPASHVVRAVFRATAHGAYEARIGGRAVSDTVLSPGWSAYEWRLQVREDDVTHLMIPMGPRSTSTWTPSPPS